MLIAIVAISAGCGGRPKPIPQQPPLSDEQLTELNREAERMMEEMLRESEEFLDQFEVEDDSLPMTGLGG